MLQLLEELSDTFHIHSCIYLQWNQMQKNKVVKHNAKEHGGETQKLICSSHSTMAVVYVLSALYITSECMHTDWVSLHQGHSKDPF